MWDSSDVIALLGDTTGTGTVTLSDVVRAARLLGTAVVDPLELACYDLNSDHRISLSDVVQVAKWFVGAARTLPPLKASAATAELKFQEDFRRRALELPESAATITGGSTLHIDTERVKTIATGDILIIGGTEAYEVETPKPDESGFVVGYSQPNLRDFLQSVNYEGEAVLNMTDFIPAEGVTVERISSGQSRLSVPEGEFSADKGFRLSKQLDITDGWKLELAMVETIQNIRYKLDMDLWPYVNVRDAYVTLDQQAAFTAEVKCKTGNILSGAGFEKTIKLGSAPVFAAYGLTLTIDVNAVIAADGSFTLTYNVNGDVGIAIRDNTPVNTTSLTATTEAGIAGSMTAGPELEIAVNVLGQKVLSYAGEIGVKVSSSEEKRPTDMVCVAGRLTLYGDLSALKGSLIGEWLELSPKWTFWDETTSPIDLHQHFEDMKTVPACTYKDEATPSLSPGLPPSDRPTANPSNWTPVVNRGDEHFALQVCPPLPDYANMEIVQSPVTSPDSAELDVLFYNYDAMDGGSQAVPGDTGIVLWDLEDLSTRHCRTIGAFQDGNAYKAGIVYISCEGRVPAGEWRIRIPATGMLSVNAYQGDKALSCQYSDGYATVTLSSLSYDQSANRSGDSFAVVCTAKASSLQPVTPSTFKISHTMTVAELRSECMNRYRHTMSSFTNKVEIRDNNDRIMNDAEYVVSGGRLQPFRYYDLPLELGSPVTKEGKTPNVIVGG